MNPDGQIDAKVFDSDDDIGDDWMDSPAKCVVSESHEIIPGEEDQTGVETREALIAECEKRGILIDKRWGIGRLHAELDANPE